MRKILFGIDVKRLLIIFLNCCNFKRFLTQHPISKLQLQINFDPMVHISRKVSKSVTIDILTAQKPICLLLLGITLYWLV